MPIHKIESHQSEIPYDMVSRDTINQITNPHALAIWLYLTSKPKHWIPRRNHIKQHFSIGDVAYKKAIDQLKELGLYEVEIVRDEKGQVTENRIHIYPTCKADRIVEKPDCGKTGIRINSKLREEEIIREEESIKDTQRNNSRFTPPKIEEVKAYCEERRNSIDPERFIDHYEANGWVRGKTKIKDWKACVRTWEKSSTTQVQEFRGQGI